MERYPLPHELRGLPTVVATRHLQLNRECSRPNLEGVEFDRDANLMVCRRLHPGSEVLRISPDGEVESIYREDESSLIGCAVHQDGRMFLCDIKGRLPVISPEGELLFDLMDVHGLARFTPNDLTFDSDGNVYVTDFHENPVPIVAEGGVYRFDAASGYETWRFLIGGMTTPNGIGFSPDCGYLWACESMLNNLIRVTLDSNKEPIARFRQLKRVLHTNGSDMMDSLKVDDDGNVYIAMMGDGRVLVTNCDGVAVLNVVLEDRAEGHCLMSPNLAIHPLTNEGYVAASGDGGSWIYRFETLAPAHHMYAFA